MPLTVLCMPMLSKYYYHHHAVYCYSIVQLPQNDELDLKEAANICNEKIILSVDKMVVYVYHASSSILNPLEVYQETMEFVTFYLD